MTMQTTPAGIKRVEHVPAVLGGRAVVKGTRIGVGSVVLAAREYGGGVDAVLDAYPHLTAEDVADALAYYVLHREEIDVDIADLSDESPLDEDEDDPLDADARGG
jgi:uncharacterized protein (DUF433 family)